MRSPGLVPCMRTLKELGKRVLQVVYGQWMRDDTNDLTSGVIVLKTNRCCGASLVALRPR